jgi:hypothetical protein
VQCEARLAAFSAGNLSAAAVESVAAGPAQPDRAPQQLPGPRAEIH